jgi:peptide chain release factor subunit 1
MVVVVDGQHTDLYEYYMDELVDLGESVDAGIRSTDERWSSGVTDDAKRRAEEHRRRHLRETANLAAERFRDRGAELIMIGGPAGTADELIPFLPIALRGRVAGTFAIDRHTMTAKDLHTQCAEVDESYERGQERAMVQELLDTAGAGGLATVGLDHAIAAANAHAISLLLIDRDAAARGAVCDSCGWLTREAGPCPLDGASMRSTPDVVDELAEMTVDDGGQIEHVFAETPLADAMVGAMLRFPVPPGLAT